MRKFLLVASVMLAMLAATSCDDGDEPTPMTWEFSDYDVEQISAVYAPDYYAQVQINAKPGCTGEITLKCTNFPVISFMTWDSDRVLVNDECGFSVTQVNDNTIRLTFTAVKATSGSDKVIEAYVGINGKSNGETAATNLRITRAEN
ncbi:MAG: hypothetical protein ACI4UN_08515 [Muribaculaceae bacterium]